MSITLSTEDQEVVIEGLLLKIKDISTKLDDETCRSHQQANESSSEILKIYKFIESKNLTAELLDFAYESAKKGDLDDINDAILLLDHNAHIEGSEDRWHKLHAMKKALELCK